MKRVIISVSAALSVLLSGCGQGYKVHKLVENFLEQQMNVAGYDVVEWGKIDSTFRVSSDVLAQMRHQGNLLIKRTLPYQAPTNKLNYITVKYVKTGAVQDTVSQTFYLNDQMTGVVAFKNN